MTRIDEELSKVYTLKDLYNFCKKPMQTELSFWGTRFITIEGLDRKLPLAKLSGTVDDIADDVEFSLLDKFWYGRPIIYKIDKLYEDCDRLIRSCNIITYLFFLLQNFPFKKYPSYVILNV